ncbi:transposase [Bacillus shivajii]|uniref:transposase n=1 Tax=Bacillus shivajii TaxID=1983719 RepID=UPI001CFBDA61|nr:transposase [Bacillus shivajii]UCZ52701.1 transposase [Bacillus shivajii]
MPRRKRIWLPDTFYHVTDRGNQKQTLFYEKSDFLTFQNVLDYVYEKYPFEVCAYCFMSNHYHFIIKSTDEPLSKIIGLIKKRYADYYNKKYNLTGHVFEDRFFADPLSSYYNIQRASYYVHYNPVNAYMVNSPLNYEWSSFKYYSLDCPTSEEPPQYLSTAPILSIFQGNTTSQKIQYNQWCKQAHTDYTTRQVNGDSIQVPGTW